VVVAVEARDSGSNKVIVLISPTSSAIIISNKATIIHLVATTELPIGEDINNIVYSVYTSTYNYLCTIFYVNVLKEIICSDCGFEFSVHHEALSSFIEW